MNYNPETNKILCQALVIAILIWISACSDNLAEYDLVQPQEQDFSVNINTIGVLDAARAHLISSLIKGNKGKIIWLIDDGLPVKAGEPLIRFDPTEFESEILTMSGKVNSQIAEVAAQENSLLWEKNQLAKEIKITNFAVITAKSELKKLISGDGPLKLAELEGELTEAKQEYEKISNFLGELEGLGQQGFSSGKSEIKQIKDKLQRLQKLTKIAQQKYDIYKDLVLPMEIEKSETKVQQLTMELEELTKGQAFKIGKSQAALQKAQEELSNIEEQRRQAQLELAKTVIRAPYDGIAILFENYYERGKRKPRIGDTVWPNKPLVYLPDISSFMINTKVREIDLHKINIDQEVVISIDAFPDLLLTGKITATGALAEKAKAVNAGKYFKVSILLEQTDPRLRPGMTASIAIVCQKAEKALALPIQAIFHQHNQKICFKVAGKYFRPVVVQTGLQNDDLVEITAGLSGKDRVALSRPVAHLIREEGR